MDLYWKVGGTWVPVPEEVVTGDVVYSQERIESDPDLQAALGIKEMAFLASAPPPGQRLVNWERADTSDEPRFQPVYGYAELTGAQWRTLIRGLPAGARTALRNAVVAADTDASEDAVYFAAQYLKGEPEMAHARVLAALVQIGLTLTQTQLDALNARWAAAAALS